MSKGRWHGKIEAEDCKNWALLGCSANEMSFTCSYVGTSTSTPAGPQQMTHMHAKLFTLDNWVKPSKSMEGKEEEEEEEEEEDVSWPAV